MQYIVLDLEFNQAFPFKTEKKVKPVPECPFEIIQIGAVKLDEHFAQTATFNQMICPRIYPKLHPFVEKITGLTEADLENQGTFAEAYEAFLAFIGKEDTILCTWGPDDIKSLFRNILYYNLDADALSTRYINIQPYASSYLKQDAGHAIGLKNAATQLGLPIELTFHNALHDAIYTAKIFHIVHPESVVPDVFPLGSLLTQKPKRMRIDKRALYHHFTALLNRELTENEKKLIKLSYALGRNQTYDVLPPKKKKRTESKS